MSNRIRENVIKGILVLSISLIANVNSSLLFAQSAFRKSAAVYLGLDATFGTRSFTLISNIDDINRMNVLDEGGTLGIIAGNDIVQATIRQGYFYSAGNVPYTTNMIETALNLNITPLQMINVKFRSIEPYVSVGIERNAVKLHGTYISNEYKALPANQNSSITEQPYLGRITVIRTSAAFGVQFRIPCQASFLKVFTEARVGSALGQRTSSKWFEKTKVSDQVGINVGVSFGYIK